MQIGVDSFVAATVDAAGRAVDPAKHLSELLEAITLADEVAALSSKHFRSSAWSSRTTIHSSLKNLICF
jgi:hypothetical protein